MPENWQSVQVIQLHKKEDKLKIEKCSKIDSTYQNLIKYILYDKAATTNQCYKKPFVKIKITGGVRKENTVSLNVFKKVKHK